MIPVLLMARFATTLMEAVVEPSPLPCPDELRTWGVAIPQSNLSA